MKQRIILNFLSFHFIARQRYGKNYPLPNEPRFAELNRVDCSTNPVHSLKIVSFNLIYGLRIKEAIELFQTETAVKDADVILLQEMSPDGVDAMAQALRMNYVYYPACIHYKHKKDFGNAILSRWPLQNDSKLIFEHRDVNELQRIAIGAIMDVCGKKVAIFNVHAGLYLTTAERIDQVNQIVAAVPNVDYAIVGGDFNTFLRRHRLKIAEAFHHAGYEHATAKVRWTYKYWYLGNRKVQLDFIFAKGLKPSDSGSLPRLRLSDHSAIWSRLDLT